MPGCQCRRHTAPALRRVQTPPCEPGCTCKRHQGAPCPEGCHCKKHDLPPCEPDCTCGKHNAWKMPKCPPNCRCARHRGGRQARPVVIEKHRVQFLHAVSPPYDCAYCGTPTRLEGNRGDRDYLVLARRDGDRRNTAVENLVPYHRRCLTITLRAKRSQDSQAAELVPRSADDGLAPGHPGPARPRPAASTGASPVR
jgi:hypothetical protein